MTRQQLNFLFLNVGHFLDHFFVLIFATVAAVTLTREWNMSYAGLIPYATAGFVAFGLCAIPAGWLADKWSREGMMVIFFIGIGASAILVGTTDSPLGLGLCLTLMGVFAAIYHPVGIAMVVQGYTKTGVPLAINGIFGNLGVATAALATGLLVDVAGWRMSFVIPGVLSILIGIAYFLFVRRGSHQVAADSSPKSVSGGSEGRALIFVFAIIFFTTALGGLVFQSTTFALPKILDERLVGLAGSATAVGGYAFVVFAIAAVGQLLVGYLMDNYSARTVFAGVAAMQMVFFVFMVQATGLFALLVAVGFMLFVFGQIPINDVLVGRLARSQWRARAYAARYIVTFTVSATAIPLISTLHARVGFKGLFWVLAVVALLILAAALALPRGNRAVLGSAAAEAG